MFQAFVDEGELDGVEGVEGEEVEGLDMDIQKKSY